MVDGPQFSSQEIHETHPLSGKNAVITGTSSGIGRSSALMLADAGADITGTNTGFTPESYERQVAVVEAARDLNPNVNFQSVVVDITIPEHRRRLLEAAVGGDLSAPTRKVDVLVLNAAGGLEEGKGWDWADKINTEAQLALVDEFLPYMNEDSLIILIQSSPGYHYGKTRQHALYEAVARTKFATQEELTRRIPELALHRVKVGFLVGDVITETGAFSVLRHFMRKSLEERRKQTPGEKFATADEMGFALREMILAPGESGFTRFVGLDTPVPYDESLFGRRLERNDIAQLLSMYDVETLKIDAFTLTDPNSGVATYKVRPEDFEGYYGGHFRRIKLMHLQDLTKMAVQTAELLVAGTRIMEDGALHCISANPEQFLMGALPNEELTTLVKFEGAFTRRVVCSAQVYGQGETPLATVDKIVFEFFPDPRVILFPYREQRDARGVPRLEE